MTRNERLAKALKVLPYYGFRLLNGWQVCQDQEPANVPLRSTVDDPRELPLVVMAIPRPAEKPLLQKEIIFWQGERRRALQEYLSGQLTRKVELPEVLPVEDDALIRLLWLQILDAMTKIMANLHMVSWLLKDLENLTAEMPMRLVLREAALKAGKEKGNDLLATGSHLPKEPSKPEDWHPINNVERAALILILDTH
jgi:hypothetical protein